MDEPTQSIRARWIIPVCRRPIHNGVVTYSHRCILSVERYQGQQCVDMGGVALMPGLVNAHTHLEFSDLETPIGNRGISIADWLPMVVQQRQQQAQTPEQRFNAIAQGIEESQESGVALIGEIATKPWPHERIAERLECSQSSIYLQTFLEVLGLSEPRKSELLSWASDQLSVPTGSCVQWGLSPHAPYTCAPDVIDRIVSVARQNRLPLAMHLAETLEEREFIEAGTGPLKQTFSSWKLSGLEQFPLQRSLAEMIELLASAPSAMLVHANYLKPDEIEVVAKHPQLSVVYCPRTHHFFGHPKHPVREFLDAGINVALGTDSRASNPDLSIWREVQFLLAHRSDLKPEEIVWMATAGGAKALRNERFGQLTPGTIPRVLTIDTIADSESRLWETLAESDPTPMKTF